MISPINNVSQNNYNTSFGCKNRMINAVREKFYMDGLITKAKKAGTISKDQIKYMNYSTMLKIDQFLLNSKVGQFILTLKCMPKRLSKAEKLERQRYASARSQILPVKELMEQLNKQKKSTEAIDTLYDVVKNTTRELRKL